VAVDTINYDPSLEDRLRDPIQHLWKATVFPASGPSFDLAVDGELAVSFSLGWSPYAQASLTVKTPATAAERAVLDGRLRTYVSISLGYAFDAATTDMNEAVRLRIRDVVEDVIAGTMKITLQGHEMDAQDAVWSKDWNGLIPRAGVREAIEYILAQSFNGPVTIYNPGYGLGYRPDLVADVNPNEGDNIWSIVSGIANSAGLKLWHDGGYTWKLLPRYNTTGDTYATMLRTGKTGTITSITRSLSRTEWFNEARLVFVDMKDGLGRPMIGRASVTTGPYSFREVGMKAYSRTVTGYANALAADTAARAFLKTLSARGTTYTIQAAAAYWIRPGMIVPIKTGRGPYERQLVESVTYTPLNGLMTLDTIKNEDEEIA